MVWDFASTEHRLFYSDHDRWLFHIVQHIPARTVVWLGRSAAPETFFSQGTYTKTAEPQLDVFLVTIANGRPAAQVVTVDDPAGLTPNYLFDNGTVRGQDAVVRVWPTQTRGAWPPSVSAESLWRFHTRVMLLPEATV